MVAPKTSMYALAGDTGKLLWSAPQPRSGYAWPKDLFLIDGLIWYGDPAGGDPNVALPLPPMTGRCSATTPPEVAALMSPSQQT